MSKEKKKLEGKFLRRPSTPGAFLTIEEDIESGNEYYIENGRFCVMSSTGLNRYRYKFEPSAIEDSSFRTNRSTLAVAAQSHPSCWYGVVVRRRCKTRAVGDGHGNFEPRSSDEDDTSAVVPSSPHYHSHHTNEMILSLDRFNAHQPFYKAGLQWHQDSGPRHSGREFVIITNLLSQTPCFYESKVTHSVKWLVTLTAVRRNWV
ncbi:hypothetical protein TNCV_4428851 [Trichonephila clavipes]|nr:hypothetical protein TNCV_4428851 [Trichonephila clavipes]